MNDAIEPAFGALAPTAAQEAYRKIAHHLPRNYWGRKFASVLLWLSGARERRGFDVEIFGGLKARLHPADNICEKRIYLTPHHWDPEERRLLSEAIRGHKGGTYYFVDVGANVGLYFLAAVAAGRAAGVLVRGICIEPDEEVRARLETNLKVNSLKDEVSVAAVAVGETCGIASFDVNSRSRGQSRLLSDGDQDVQVFPLLDVVNEAGLKRIDAMKVDIEGHELPALRSFFGNAPDFLRPQFLFVEVSHDPTLANFLQSVGYEAIYANSLNAVFVDARRGAIANQKD
ncbi:MAG: FkbM family methyltransferase [Alphaproteobacteria bacterium]|nr:FkbM family methyltransferase [Alphaproteobacteria bacterium]